MILILICYKNEYCPLAKIICQMFILLNKCCCCLLILNIMKSFHVTLNIDKIYILSIFYVQNIIQQLTSFTYYRIYATYFPLYSFSHRIPIHINIRFTRNIFESQPDDRLIDVIFLSDDTSIDYETLINMVSSNLHILLNTIVSKDKDINIEVGEFEIAKFQM